jgi:hypothetical protein
MATRLIATTPANRLRAAKLAKLATPAKPDQATLIRNAETGSLRLRFAVGKTTFEVRVFMPEGAIDDETHEALTGTPYPISEPVCTQQITLWLDASRGRKSPCVLVYAAEPRKAVRSCHR